MIILVNQVQLLKIVKAELVLMEDLYVGKRQSFLCSFDLDKRLGQKMKRKSRIRVNERISKDLLRKIVPLVENVHKSSLGINGQSSIFNF